MTSPRFAAHPALLGFDRLDALVERISKAGSDGYPPFNIEQTSPTGLRISVAVAGFAEADLAITVEDRHLLIRGRKAPEEAERRFLHRGIATRQFQRGFVLAEGVEVGGASLKDGLLHVDLERREPETVVRRVPITTAKEGS